MCGIFGIKRLENDAGILGPPILPVQIDLMLNSLEYRGNDAAGVALIGLSGEIFVHKDHEPAWDVTASPKYREFLEANLNEDIICVLGHTRKATKGNPFRNPNNHPLIKDAGVVVHNGMISNDDRLFADLKLERGAETDSDILRALLDQAGGVSPEALKSLGKVMGSVASALVHPADPTKLLLLRSGNPLVTADDGQVFYFASDKRAIYRGARPWIKRHGFTMQLQSPNIAFVTMPNDTGWIVGSQGLEWHDKFSSTSFRYRYANYGEVYSPNGRIAKRDRQRTEVEKAAEKVAVTVVPDELPQLRQVGRHFTPNDAWSLVNYVRCPNSECDVLSALSEAQSRQPLTNLRCAKCKTNLHGAVQACRLLQKEDLETRPQVH